MKLKNGFLTHESANEHITVTTGTTAFNGMIRSNRTAGFLVECLKENVTKEDIYKKMLQKYDVPREVLEKDVEAILTQLYSIGAIDD